MVFDSYSMTVVGGMFGIEVPQHNCNFIHVTV